MKQKDLVDALEHMSDLADRDLDPGNFSISSIQQLPVSELGMYDDVDAWAEWQPGELEDLDQDELESELRSFRGSNFAKRALGWIYQGKMDPIVVVELANGDTAIGDGRGRSSVAIGLGLDRIPAVFLEEKSVVTAGRLEKLQKLMQKYPSAEAFGDAALGGFGAKSANTISAFIDKNSRTSLNMKTVRSEVGNSAWYFLHKLPVSSLPVDEVDPTGEEDIAIPIVVSADLNVLDGRHRIALARQNGVEELPAYIPAELLYRLTMKKASMSAQIKEAKVKAILRAGSEGGLNKGHFGVRNKNQAYQTATWKWVVPRVEKWNASNAPDLEIKVGVWDLEGQPAHDTMGKTFAPRDLKGAKKYAKELVEQGKASLTDMRGMAYFPYEGKKIVENFGMYEPAEEKKQAKVKQANAPTIIRPEGWEATSDETFQWLDSISTGNNLFRGMNTKEFDATIGAGKPIKSTGEHSFSHEGTNFSKEAGDAESYVNYGRDDPRNTGKPTYLVQIDKSGLNIKKDTDGYWKTPDEVPLTSVTGVWKFVADEEGNIVAESLKSAKVAKPAKPNKNQVLARKLQMAARMLQADLFAKSAARDLAPMVSTWIHGPSKANKDAIFQAYENLEEKRKAAYDVQVAKTFQDKFGSSVVAYRYKKAGKGGDVGGWSVSTKQPEYLAPDKYSAYLIKPGDVLVHWAQDDMPLGRGSFAHEEELILRPGAKPRKLH